MRHWISPPNAEYLRWGRRLPGRDAAVGSLRVYDLWDKPDKSQPCWHRDSAIAEKKRGESDPTFEGSLTNQADKLEQQSAKVQQTSASAN